MKNKKRTNRNQNIAKRVFERKAHRIYCDKQPLFFVFGISEFRTWAPVPVWGSALEGVCGRAFRAAESSPLLPVPHLSFPPPWSLISFYQSLHSTFSVSHCF